jgi:hypothetical protein
MPHAWNFSGSSVDCSNCGKRMFRPPSQISARNFCNVLCRKSFFDRINKGHYRGKTISGIRRDEHRVIMEGILGRKLLGTERVHHINGNKRDNSAENLIVLSVSDHVSLHRPARWDQKRAIELFKLGLSFRKIAFSVGANCGNVYSWLKKHGYIKPISYP